ncbi:hypothetical protein [Nannocystis radixulma]|uniref:DUF3592 domain-containing protein n=1 Tax=Nannocystis radixulma TaxID=2995305 RepID=A0ABT5BP20_9BACT|nr:hypothetical protein [Nannocystis radixulma]MDC0675852.1 hypothetical protein [Nannocystis radixulma]
MSGFPAALAYAALAMFWLNTLLVMAAGWGECARLLRRWGARARAGVVVEGTGPEGQIAVHRVRQVGRSKGDANIWFHDRAYEGEVLGGVVAVGAEQRALADATVWVSRARQRAAAACPDAQAFASAKPPATRAAGWGRAVEVSLGTGDRVWLSEGPDGVLIADADPARWRRKIAGLTVALVLGLGLVGALCTALCLWPPVFGTVSKLGALASLVVFNLFQLFGKLHHEAIQPPGHLALRGVWRAPA